MNNPIEDDRADIRDYLARRDEAGVSDEAFALHRKQFLDRVAAAFTPTNIIELPFSLYREKAAARTAMGADRERPIARGGGVTVDASEDAEGNLTVHVSSADPERDANRKVILAHGGHRWEILLEPIESEAYGNVTLLAEERQKLSPGEKSSYHLEE